MLSWWHASTQIPSAIHHVIIRGLNRQDIFLDDCDRNDFLGRLEKNLSLTGCRCCLSAQVIDLLGDLMRKVCVLASLTDRYRWSGHSVLAGCRRRIWQDRGEILSHFGLKKWEAVRQYWKFIEDGFNMGRREDLTGGGLRRNAGGREGVLEGIGPVFRYIPAFSLAGHQVR